MSIDTSLGNVQSLSNTISTGTRLVTRTAADLGLGVDSSKKYWKDTLQKASYCGVPFGVLGGESAFGRKNVLHTYPFRDSVWVEDLGRSARRIHVTGFLVGDDCIAQRDRMIEAFEEEGDGELVHPTLGTMTVSQLGPLNVRETWDRGRMFEISFTCIEAGKRQFPGVQEATEASVASATMAANAASAADFAARVGTAIKTGAAAVAKAATMATTLARRVQRLSNDATNLSNMASKLEGDFSRYFGGGNEGIRKRKNTSGDSVATLIAKGSKARTNISVVSGNLASSAGDATMTATAAQEMASALANAAPDPADAIRLLSGMAGFTMPAVSMTSPIGEAIATVQNGTADLYRRAAVIAMAKASASYQPSSADDAVAVRTKICNALDIEIQVAGDQGEDDTFNTLRTLRSAVAMDLNKRGAGLPSIVMMEIDSPMPSLVLAYRFYGDANRADELVTQANCVHPAFMPVSFKALSR